MRTPRSFVIALGAAGLILCGQAAPAWSASAKAPAVAKPTGDAVAGEKVFSMRCVSCHMKGGAGGALGPPLKGAYGAKAGSSGWDKYSPALKGSGLVWTEASLDSFLLNPRKAAPGTKMMVMITKPEDRKNLAAYLATLKK